MTGIPVACMGDDKFASMGPSGILQVKEGYRFDGSSGPAIDTKSSQLAALVHDCLYQLMRQSQLSTKWRKKADQIYRDLCIKGGMTRARAYIRYFALRIGGGKHAKPTRRPKVLTAP